jgi:four helix bundle protein
MRDFKELIVWQRSCEATRAAYMLSRRFPADELYGMTSQVRRAAISVSANIAEGWARFSAGDQARCYRIASASAAELECLLILAGQLDLIPVDNAEKAASLAREVQRMLAAMIRHCTRARPLPRPSP